MFTVELFVKEVASRSKNGDSSSVTGEVADA
jgi:hypothetical protein